LNIHGSKTIAGTGLHSVNKSKPGVGGNGKAVCWYQEHWQPVDKGKYLGKVHKDAALRSRLAADSPLMVCKHCQEFTRRFNPCTKFKHLLSCEDVKATDDYKALDCQKAVAAVESLQVCLLM
jgi:predicted  nucleic acid-binding Zn ribbon protein